MKFISKIVLLSLITLTVACSGAKKVTTNNTSSSNSLYPAWYGSYEFSSDSSSFTSRATAVAGDSETAKLRAEKEARALLESYIAKELEDIRSELERDGSEVVKKPDFILLLRNAHVKIEEGAIVAHSEAAQNEGVYRGFARVEISKKEVHGFIENGFNSKKAYQREFMTSQSFKEFVGN